jgi:CHAT domain-containing protein
VVEERYFGTDEELKKHKSFGIAIIRWKYDGKGNVIEERYFGPDERLKKRKDWGFAIRRFQYDEHGKRLKTVCFDENENVTSVQSIFNEIGKDYFYSGDYPESIVAYRKALEIYRDAGDKKSQGITLNQIGDSYALLADYDKAMQVYQDALQLSKEIREKYVEVFALCGIGFVNFLLGNNPDSLTSFQAAEKLSRKAGIKDAQVFAGWGMGEAYANLGKHSKARRSFERTLQVSREIKYELFEAGALLGIGKEYSLSGNYEKASQFIEEAVETLNRIGFLGYIWVCRYELGKNSERQGKFREAIDSYKLAIENIESIREKLKTECQRALFVEDKMLVYEDLITLLRRVGDDAGAFDYLERAKARAFLDMLGNKKITAGNDVAPFLLEKEKVLRDEIAALGKATGSKNNFASAKRRTEIQEEGASINPHYEALKIRGSSLITEYDQTLQRIQGQSREVASLLSINPLRSTEIQELLGKDAVILEYFIGGNQAFVFVVTRERIISKHIETRPDEIKSLVLDFRKKEVEKLNLAKPDQRNYKQPLSKLYNCLILPIQAEIEGGKHLIIVPHGVLHYLPFQALITEQNGEGRYLLEDFRISYSPSATVLKFAQDKNKRQRGNLLAFGNPTTDLENLPMAEEEAKMVSSFYRSSDLYLKTDATETRAKKESSGYDILHFATHGVLDRFNPLDSNLRLTEGYGEDGRLTVDEVFDMNLSAYLVTLSACETGLGVGYQGLKKGELRRRDIDFPPGDEVVGLSRGFIYAGTPSVVASLWKVSDESTAKLMEVFYKNLQSMDKAEALRQAQLKLMRSGRETSPQRGVAGIGQAKSSGETIDTSHPYFWAPFILIGDWK